MSSALDLDPATDEARSQHLLAATRTVLDDMLMVEYRLAAVAALVERFGRDHAERAASELQFAVEQLILSERRRAAEAAAVAVAAGCPEAAPFAELIEVAHPAVRDLLAAVRARMLAVRVRIERLTERAEDVLGRRIALVAEVLAAATDSQPPAYGRDQRPKPRFVDGLL